VTAIVNHRLQSVSVAGQVVTEETQNDPSAVAFNLDQPRAMYDAHDWWLAALKVRSERAALRTEARDR